MKCNTAKLIQRNDQKYVNFQIELGGELGQPDLNFGPLKKKCTLECSGEAYQKQPDGHCI